MGLLHRRRKNLQRAFDRTIEQADQLKPTAAIVSAVRPAADLSSQGEWVETGERTHPKALFDRMAPEEPDAYAATGELPAWFPESSRAGDDRVRLANSPDAASPLSSSPGEHKAGS